LYSVIPILLLIARSKLVPDFAITVHMINLLVTTVYTRSIPTNVYWWGLQICSSALMIALGIWACQWRELKPMAFGGSGGGGGKSKGKERATDGAANGHLPEADQGEGYEMGAARGKGRDGAGSYEMVGMAPKEPV